MRHPLRLAEIILVVTFAFSATVWAQYEIRWYTVGGGGNTSTSSSGYSVSGTIGQPAALPQQGGGAYSVSGGFWPAANVCWCLGDVNGDGKKDGRDVQQFVECVLGGGDCSCADVDQVGGVTLADVPVFVADLLAGPTCP